MFTTTKCKEISMHAFFQVKLHRVAALKRSMCRTVDKMKSKKLPESDVSPRHFPEVYLRTWE